VPPAPPEISQDLLSVMNTRGLSAAIATIETVITMQAAHAVFMIGSFGNLEPEPT
jgi:hypothetical protein